ncbi:hypothetical protein GCM10010965_19530 [Caldalkalibacillus thermarum]|uniref:hypothetical protein n=1 Tax=Caldalkalibacillus thermarum TaxID=296745 RepID=UPI001664E51E|nr:hypothetical protein [Caldalkalibacillus thermarum]GGK26891.1 hypothetical protein GCM10010965_19530 [Caldalkalibacillus thermarum]
MIRQAVIWSCCLLVLGLWISPSLTQAAADSNAYLTISVKSSPAATCSTSLTIKQRYWVDLFQNPSFEQSSRTCTFPAAYLSFYSEGNTIHYLADEQGCIFDATGQQQLKISHNTRRKLQAYLQLLKKKHYGELLPWEEVQTLLPRKATFEIIDLETGLRFRAQRRAGSKHADVQPLTRHDTKIMKEIYQGKWSWKRRAILVHIDNRLIAASMHGMPHGRGALRNGFPGHFCVHFLESTTHRTQTLDPTHQLMVYKAAGQLAEYLSKADPYDLVDIFIMALNQHDQYLLQQLLPPDEQTKWGVFFNNWADLQYVYKVSKLEKKPAHDLLYLEVPVKIQLYWKNRGKDTRQLTFTLMRPSPAERWSVDCDLLSSGKS